jgi:HD-like signal output (HDOD) protein
MKKIMFVDDEPNVLQGLRRMLRPMRSEWEMSFAEGPERALEMLASGGYHVVVTDMRMPHMNGADLLKEVLSLDSSIARIILSGQTDKEGSLRSSGIAHQFLAKPCDAKDLKHAVQRACQLRDLMNTEVVRRAIGRVGSLPSLPATYLELTAEMESEDLSLKRVGDIVAHDVALTAKILQLVNSAFFGLPRHVENVAQAISFLGAETIRSLVLSTAVFRSFDGEPADLNLEELWSHSFSVGSLALAIAKEETPHKVVMDEALQAGMLHDVGQLVLATGVPERYCDVRELRRSEDMSQSEAELAVFGCDHAQAGAYLMGLWGLPDGIVEAIAYHHHPLDCPSSEFTPLTAVHAANELVHAYMRASDQSSDILCADLDIFERQPEKRKAWSDLTRRTLGHGDVP